MWCGICQTLAESQQSLVDEYQSEGFTKATVLKGDASYDDVDQDEALYWKESFLLEHPVLYDEDRAVWTRWKRTANSVPQQYLVDGGGAIRWRKVGRESEEELQDAIEEALSYND